MIKTSLYSLLYSTLSLPATLFIYLFFTLFIHLFLHSLSETPILSEKHSSLVCRIIFKIDSILLSVDYLLHFPTTEVFCEDL